MADAELQLDRRKHNNLPGRTRTRQDKCGGRGGGKLGDVRQRCHKRQHGNQSGQMRGKREVESPGQREAAMHQEAVVLTRGWEAEAAQRDAT